MPGKVKVKIISGRNLPVMDRSSDTTDAYVEIKLGSTTYKTDVCRKSLHPQWNSEWYRFEVDDSELQDEPLQIRLMDHDTYSANDAIGKVYLDLNPLLLPAANLLHKWNRDADSSENANSVMSGWIPVYDTMHGIRGEVNVIVKVELFTDFNKFRQSSCGVRFFCSPVIPHGYFAQAFHGFVEELVVSDDPEYQWIDKIRTPRASNEARQTLFFKLSGELQRKIGVKALDLGGNAVIGYSQNFDLEGESGIVARGIGTAVTLVKILDLPYQSSLDSNVIHERAQSYLKFLGSAKGFFLHGPTDTPSLRAAYTLPLPSPSRSLRSLKLDDCTNQHMTRHLSDKEFNSKVSTEELHHSASLQTLLKQENMRGVPGYGISQKIKNFKYSSQNMLNKHITALKAKLDDGSESAEQKKRVLYGYRRTQSDSSGMAELLVRSVFQATSSLDCIVETHDINKVSQLEDGEDEEVNILKESAESYVSLQDASCETRSSNASSSSESFSMEDEEVGEVDTVSHIVETVRKLSTINNPIFSLNDDVSDTFVIDELNVTETFDPENKSTEHFGSVINKDIGESFLPQMTKAFQMTMKKSKTATCLVDMDSKVIVENAKFTSLHDIHDAFAKFNKYSAHKGKETVLGELFRRVEMKSNTSIPETNLNFKNEQHTNKILEFFKDGKDKIVHQYQRIDSKIHTNKEESSLKNPHGLLGTALENVLIDSCNEVMATSRGIVPAEANKVKDDSSKIGSIFKASKGLLHRLDSKFHKKEPVKPESLLETALGNVLMESVNEVLATSHSEPSSPNKSADDKKRGFFISGKEKMLRAPRVILKRFDSNPKNVTQSEPGTPVSRNNSEEEITHSTKGFSNRLLSAPKKLMKKMQRSEGGVKKQTGLLGTALGNVLMDSVNDVLATSHTASSETDSNKINGCANSTPPCNVDTVNTEIGTIDSNSINTVHACLTPSLRNTDTSAPEVRTDMGHQRAESVGTKISQSPANLNSIPCIHRRSSDSDLSITPKGFYRKRNSLTGNDRSAGYPNSGHFSKNAMIRSAIAQENFDIMEYPFMTMSKYPPGFVTFIGGAVSARSVKLLERITNIEEPESRDTWWSEIRMEIRSHARALNCNAVLGYSESTTICDDVCVLSANGTAATIGYQYAMEALDSIGVLPIIPKPVNNDLGITNANTSKSPDNDLLFKQACSICHLPYQGNSAISRNTSSTCAVCRLGKVPEVLIATIEIPDGIPSTGRGCFVQSYVCRPLRDLKGESNAKEISDGLPFLEYELHRLLINKLKVKGMNAVFGLKVRVSVGERVLIGIATGTALFLSALPAPSLPKLVSDRTSDLAQLQKSLHDTVKKNKETYQLTTVDEIGGKTHSYDDSGDDKPSLDLSMGNKDCCILEIDDPRDVDELKSLMEPAPPDGFHVVNTEMVPGLEELEIVKNLQMFTQIWRAKIPTPFQLDKHFQRLLQSMYFKLRRMIPCALCDLQFRVDSPEPDEIQLCVLGMALGLGDPPRKSRRKTILTKRNEDDLIFNLEADNIPENSVVETATSTYLHTQPLKHRQKSPIRSRLASSTKQRHVPYRERHGVDITPLSYVPGGKIEKYLGNLNFFFIRETTSIREEGGLSGFVHSFVTEILAIVRAHVMALGGNAMVAYFLTECVLNHNLHKNQGQCLINVGGDVVHVSYFAEDY